jgi:hypothetical protein
MGAGKKIVPNLKEKTSKKEAREEVVGIEGEGGRQKGGQVPVHSVQQGGVLLQEQEGLPPRVNKNKYI